MKYTFSAEYERSLMPDELLEIAFNFDRDVRKIWELDLPTEDIPVADLAWHLEMPFFWQPDRPFSLKPQAVLDNPEQYQAWMERIMQVDISYPIDIIWWKDKWEILDGLHRFCKHIVLGHETVPVRKVPLELKEQILPDV